MARVVATMTPPTNGFGILKTGVQEAPSARLMRPRSALLAFQLLATSLAESNCIVFGYRSLFACIALIVLPAIK